MGRKRRRWSKKAEKEYERRERELAEEKAKARSDSEDRQQKIKVRWDLDEQQLNASKNKDRKLTEQKLKEQKLKDLLKSARDSTDDDNLLDRISELIELAALQDREIEYLMKFRRDWEEIETHYPDQLENLYITSLLPIFRLDAVKLSALREQQNWEHKRQRYKLSSGVGLIEYEFGGAGETEWRKHSLSGPLGLPYQPTCLDRIFGGGSVKMHESKGEPGLQNLFGMHRNRLKNLPAAENGRETWYDYRAVVKMMHRLLSEKPRESETPTRGRTRRPWPSNPGLRICVLTGIVSRMERLSVSGDIWDAFAAVVCLHLHEGIVEWLSEDDKTWLATIVRRYLTGSAKK
jgi:hypothetical protein